MKRYVFFVYTIECVTILSRRMPNIWAALPNCWWGEYTFVDLVYIYSLWIYKKKNTLIALNIKQTHIWSWSLTGIIDSDFLVCWVLDVWMFAWIIGNTCVMPSVYKYTLHTTHTYPHIHSPSGNDVLIALFTRLGIQIMRGKCACRPIAVLMM